MLFTAINVLGYILRDSAILHELLGELSAGLINSICAAVAGLTVGSATIVAGVSGAPLFAAIAVGVLVGYVLYEIDEKYGATKVLIEAYEKMGIELTSTWDAILSIPSQQRSHPVRNWIIKI